MSQGRSLPFEGMTVESPVVLKALPEPRTHRRSDRRPKPFCYASWQNSDPLLSSRIVRRLGKGEFEL